MFNRRIRILSGLLIAFIIVNFYGRLSKTPFISPIQANNFKNLLSNIKFNPNSLVKFFTIKFDSKETELVSRLDNKNNSFSLTPIVQPSPTHFALRASRSRPQQHYTQQTKLYLQPKFPLPFLNQLKFPNQPKFRLPPRLLLT